MSPYTAVSILSCPPAARPPEPGQAANRPKLTQGQTRVTAVPQGTPQGRLSSRVWRSPQRMPGSRWVGVPCSVPRSPAVPTQGLQPGSTELCLHPWVTLPPAPQLQRSPCAHAERGAGTPTYVPASPPDHTPPQLFVSLQVLGVPAHPAGAPTPGSGWAHRAPAALLAPADPRAPIAPCTPPALLGTQAPMGTRSPIGTPSPWCTHSPIKHQQPQQEPTTPLGTHSPIGTHSFSGTHGPIRHHSPTGTCRAEEQERGHAAAQQVEALHGGCQELSAARRPYLYAGPGAGLPAVGSALRTRRCRRSRGPAAGDGGAALRC